MKNLGTMVIDELMLPIVRVRLRDGRIEFMAQIAGPRESQVLRGWRVHDPDGVIVATCFDSTITIPAMAAGDYAEIMAPLECANDKVAELIR